MSAPLGQSLLQLVQQTVGLEGRLRIRTGQKLVQESHQEYGVLCVVPSGTSFGSTMAAPHEIPDSPMRFTDERRYFVSEATVYRLLKAQDLITSPADIVIKAADEFRDKTTASN